MKTIKIQLSIPVVLNKKLAIYSIEKDINYKRKAIIKILNEVLN